MPVGAEFSHPWFLLALPLLAAFLVAARWPWWNAARRAGRKALRQEGRRVGLRLVWVALMVLALSGITVTRSLDRQAAIFVLDGSASVAAVRDRAETAARSAAEQLRTGDLLGVVIAAAGARVEEAPAAKPVFTRLSAALPDGATDLVSGIRLAGALLPDGFAGRVVLVSDGRQTRGDAVAAARDLAARGVEVDVLPLGAAASPDLRLEAVDLPETAYRGEVSTLTARITADTATAGTIRVYRDDQLVLERPVDLRAGRQEVALPVAVGDPGLHRYRLDVSAVDPAADSIAANDALGAIQRVEGPPKILVIASGPDATGWLPGALSAGGAEVTVAAPSGVPSDLAGWARYDGTIVADVPAEALPRGAMDLMERYVRDLGRGLVMTGGPDSFGPGGYAETPVERTLPVYMDLRGRGRQPKVALALVIDKSGSMAGTKVEMAKEAAARSIRLLRDGDQAAVLAFDSMPQWVAPLTPVAERDRLEKGIGSIYADGGTEVYPALLAGFETLRGVDADVKHIILLTDGRSGSTGDYGELTQQMRDAHVTLSTVAVGDDADTSLLEAMARAGRGRYHFTAEPADIPEIFTKETVMATRTVLVDERFYPSAASSGPLLRGLTSVPPLDGYVATSAREQAEVVLVSPEGDPVLAAWQYGLGRAVAWTPDVAGRWSGAWGDSPATTLLWGNLLSWLLPARESGDLSVRVEPEGESGFAVVAENRGGWEAVRKTGATLLGPDGGRQELSLAPAGPGLYRSQLPVPAPGAYVVQVAQDAGGGAELRGESGWVAPYPAEFRESGVDQPLLAQVAAAGSGRVLEDPVDAVAATPKSAVARWPAWPLLLALAALFWPLEIASRRLAVPEAAAWLASARSRAPAIRRKPTLITHDSSLITPPAVRTADRLLERKRAFREKRDPRR
jgi:Ca-activated chloride channel homolog